MQLSLYTDYALRTLMMLATVPDRQSVDAIARRHAISANHLAKVAQALQVHGFVQSTRGRSGGMVLARPAQEINVGDVVRRFENLDSFVGCLGEGGTCAMLGICGLTPALRGALDSFLTHLDGITLADITANENALRRRLFAEPVTV
ncbi:MAG: Rrf2 family transcriptional regulator [Croceibacterium sp.]